MKIGVEVNDFFKRFGVNVGKFEIECNINSKIEDIVKILNIPPERIGFTVVNGKRANLDYVLSEGDNLVIIPYALGG